MKVALYVGGGALVGVALIIPIVLVIRHSSVERIHQGQMFEECNRLRERWGDSGSIGIENKTDMTGSPITMNKAEMLDVASSIDKIRVGPWWGGAMFIRLTSIAICGTLVWFGYLFFENRAQAGRIETITRELSKRSIYQWITYLFTRMGLALCIGAFLTMTLGKKIWRKDAVSLQDKRNDLVADQGSILNMVKNIVNGSENAPSASKEALETPNGMCVPKNPFNVTPVFENEPATCRAEHQRGVAYNDSAIEMDPQKQKSTQRILKRKQENGTLLQASCAPRNEDPDVGTKGPSLLEFLGINPRRLEYWLYPYQNCSLDNANETILHVSKKRKKGTTQLASPVLETIQHPAKNGNEKIGIEMDTKSPPPPLLPPSLSSVSTIGENTKAQRVLLVFSIIYIILAQRPHKYQFFSTPIDTSIPLVSLMQKQKKKEDAVEEKLSELKEAFDPYIFDKDLTEGLVEELIELKAGEKILTLLLEQKTDTLVNFVSKLGKEMSCAALINLFFERLCQELPPTTESYERVFSVWEVLPRPCLCQFQSFVVCLTRITVNNDAIEKKISAAMEAYLDIHPPNLLCVENRPNESVVSSEKDSAFAEEDSPPTEKDSAPAEKDSALTEDDSVPYASPCEACSKLSIIDRNKDAQWILLPFIAHNYPRFEAHLGTMVKMWKQDELGVFLALLKDKIEPRVPYYQILPQIIRDYPVLDMAYLKLIKRTLNWPKSQHEYSKDTKIGFLKKLLAFIPKDIKFAIEVYKVAALFVSDEDFERCEKVAILVIILNNAKEYSQLDVLDLLVISFSDDQKQEILEYIDVLLCSSTTPDSLLKLDSTLNVQTQETTISLFGIFAHVSKWNYARCNELVRKILISQTQDSSQKIPLNQIRDHCMHILLGEGYFLPDIDLSIDKDKMSKFIFPQFQEKTISVEAYLNSLFEGVLHFARFLRINQLRKRKFQLRRKASQPYRKVGKLRRRVRKFRRRRNEQIPTDQPRAAGEPNSEHSYATDMLAKYKLSLEQKNFNNILTFLLNSYIHLAWKGDPSCSMGSVWLTAITKYNQIQKWFPNLDVDNLLVFGQIKILKDIAPKIEKLVKIYKKSMKP